METLNISVDNFSDFMGIVKMMNGPCTSMSITSGRIIQTSKEKNILYDIDLTSIFGENTIYIDIIKNKGVLLDIFRRQSSKVRVDIREKDYVWSDGQTEFVFRKPDPGNLSQKPISPDSRTYKMLSSMSEHPLLKCKFDQKILEKIIASSKNLEAQKMIFSLDEDSAKFSIIMGDTNTSTYVTIFKTNDVSIPDYRGTVHFPLDIFTISTESMDIEIGFNEIASDKRLTIKLFMPINGIPTKMFSTQQFKEIPRKK